VHDRLLLFAVVAGEARTWCRGEVHTLRPGALLVVEPGEVHRDLEKTDYRAVMLMVDDDLVKAFRVGGADAVLGRAMVQSAELVARVITLARAVKEERPAPVQHDLLHGLFEALEDLRTTAIRWPDRALVARARRSLAEAPRATVSLEELARRLRCSPNYLSRIFSEHVGVAPHAYQVLHRLLEARVLIESGHTLASAAHVAGFTDESHLYRHFRRRFAVAPGGYPKNEHGATRLAEHESAERPRDGALPRREVTTNGPVEKGYERTCPSSRPHRIDARGACGEVAADRSFHRTGG